MEPATVSINVLLPVFNDKITTVQQNEADYNDPGINAIHNFSNMLTMGTKLVSQARSFDSALSVTESHQVQVTDNAR